MTEERRQELHAKYSVLFELGSRYPGFLSFLEDMEKFARFESLLTSSMSKAIGFLFCLVEVCKISYSDVILKELYNFHDDLAEGKDIGNFVK